MQTLLTLYMVNYLLVPARMDGVIGLNWLRSWHYEGLSGQPLSSAIFGDYTSLVYLTPILGGIIADRFAGRRVALFAGGMMMSIGHFLMAFEGAFLFALLALIIGVGLFKGNIASQVGALYKGNDLRRAMAFQIFYIAINVSVIVAPLISGTLGEKVGWHYGFGTAGHRHGARRADLPRRPAASAGRGGRERIDRSRQDFGHDGHGRARHGARDRQSYSSPASRSHWLPLIPLYFFLTRSLARDERCAFWR